MSKEGAGISVALEGKTQHVSCVGVEKSARGQVAISQERIFFRRCLRPKCFPCLCHTHTHTHTHTMQIRFYISELSPSLQSMGPDLPPVSFEFDSSSFLDSVFPVSPTKALLKLPFLQTPQILHFLIDLCLLTSITPRNCFLYSFWACCYSL